jgi:hypothetical protein
MEGLLLKIRAVLNHNSTSSMKSERGPERSKKVSSAVRVRFCVRKEEKLSMVKETVCVDIRRPVKIRPSVYTIPPQKGQRIEKQAF